MAVGRKTKKRLAILLSVTVLVAALVGAGVLLRNFQRTRQAKRYYAEAATLIAAGDHREAGKKLGYYVSVYPKDGEAWLLLSKSRMLSPQANSRHLLMAAQYARYAAANLPGDIRPIEHLIDLFRNAPDRLGFPRDLVDEAEKALAIDPKNYMALSEAAVAYDLLGKPDDAVRTAERLLAAYPDDPRGLTAMVQLMLRAKRSPDDIRKYVDAAAMRQPDKVKIALLQIGCRAMAGDTDGAKQAAARAADIGSTDPAVMAEILKNLDFFDMKEVSREFVSRHAQGEAGRQMVAAAAERAWTNGDIEPVRDDLTRAVTENLETATDATLGWASLLLVRDDASAPGSKALEALKARKGDEAKAWALVIEGKAALDKQDWVGAHKALADATALQRGLKAGHALLGEAELRLGESGRAIERWRTLVAQDPKWLPVRLSLVAALMGETRTEEAVREAQTAFSMWPTRYAAAMALMRSGVSLIDADRAEASFAQNLVAALATIEQNVPTGESTALAARALAALGRRDEAQAKVNRLVSGEVDAPPVDLIALAEVCRRRGLEGADALQAKAVGGAEPEPGVLFAAALASAQMGRADEGAALLREASAKSSGARAVELQRRLAMFLDSQRDPAGYEMLRASATKNEGDAGAQADLLNSVGAWSDEAVVREAIGRLRAVMGEGSTRWRVYEARRLLAFDPTPAKAASVVQPELLGIVLREEPSNVPALTLAADAMLRVDPPNRDKALEYLRKAADVADQPMLQIRSIALLQDLGRSDEAATRLREFSRRGGLSDEQTRARSDLLFRQGMWAEAEADLALLAAKGAPTDIARLGAVQARRGDATSARATFERALAAGASDAEALGLIAEFYGSAGELDKGVEILSRIPGEDEEQRALRVGGFYETASRYPQAEGALRAEAARSGSAKSWATLAGFYLRRERLDDAQAAVETGLRSAPKDKELQQMAALIAVSSGREIKGATALADAGRGDSPVQMLLAAERLRAEKPDAFAEYIVKLTEARDRHPTFLPAWRRLVGALSESGDNSAAAREAMRAASAMPGIPEAAELAVNVVASAGREEEAMGLAREWRNRTLNDPYRADVVIARLEVAAGRPQAAAAVLDRWKDRLIAEADTGPDALATYANVLASLGREEEIREVVEGLAQNNPRWATTYVSMARSMKNRQEPADAWLQRSRELIKDNVEGRLMVAQTMWDLAFTRTPPGPFEPIVETLSGLDTDKVARGRASVLLAASHERMDNPTEAERYYRIAVEEIPDAPLPLNNLAYLLVRRGGDPAEAVAYATKALEAATKQGLSPSDQRSYYDTLGVAQLKAGQLEGAAKTFSRLLELNPTDRNALLGQAEAYTRLGRREDAAVVLYRLDTATAGEPLHPDYVSRLEWVRKELGSPKK